MSILTALLGSLLVVMVGARLRPRPMRASPTHACDSPSGGSTGDAAAVDESASDGAARRESTRRLRPRLQLLVGVGAVASLLGPLAALAVAVVGITRPRLRRVRDERRHVAAISVAYPDLVDLLVLTISSGLSPAQAVSALVPVAPEVTRPVLRRVERRLSVGERFADAIGGVRDAPPIGLGAVAQPLADALALADRYGTPLAAVLDRLAVEARDQRRRNAEISARQLPIRLAFPLVGCTLPSFVLLTVVPLMAGTFSSLRGLTA